MCTCSNRLPDIVPKALHSGLMCLKNGHEECGRVGSGQGGGRHNEVVSSRFGTFCFSGVFKICEKMADITPPNCIRPCSLTGTL